MESAPERAIGKAGSCFSLITFSYAWMRERGNRARRGFSRITARPEHTTPERANDRWTGVHCARSARKVDSQYNVSIPREFTSDFRRDFRKNPFQYAIYIRHILDLWFRAERIRKLYLKMKTQHFFKKNKIWIILFESQFNEFFYNFFTRLIIHNIFQKLFQKVSKLNFKLNFYQLNSKYYLQIYFRDKKNVTFNQSLKFIKCRD